jgi:Co/Zn/Cd efflux system component
MSRTQRLVVVLVLRGDDDDEEGGERDLSVAAVLLDTVADAATAAGVAVVGAIILATDGWYWLDPAVALAISVVFGYHALTLIRKVLTRLRPVWRRSQRPPGGPCRSGDEPFV